MICLRSRFNSELIQSGDKIVKPLGWKYADEMTTKGYILINWPGW
jgi:hypothetical protein